MKIYWQPVWEFDRHLIRTQPGGMKHHNRLCPIDKFISVLESNGTYYTLDEWSDPKTQSSIKSVEFIPKFNGAPNAHGVQVDTRTGAIEVVPEIQPSPKLRNFMMEVKITHTDPNLINPKVLAIRIHVHDELQRIWLTPNPLIVHKGTRNTYLTILAQFTDDTFGEISDWTVEDFRPWEMDPTKKTAERLEKRLKWKILETYRYHLDMNLEDGEIICYEANKEAKFGVAYSNGSNTSEVIVRSIEPWNKAREVKWIKGPGPEKTNDVVNILFLPEGFQETEQEKKSFEQMIEKIIYDLADKKIHSPFNLLSINFNFWMAFVGLREESGVTIFSEVARFRQQGSEGFRVTLVPAPEEPSRESETWSLKQLVYQVGLPVKEDDPPQRPLTDSKDEKGKLKDWQQLYGSHITEKLISNKIFENWKKYADRAIVNSCNSYFGVAIGSRLSDPCGDSHSTVFFDPKRNPDEYIRDFLSSLRCVDNPNINIGELWSQSWGDQNRLYHKNVICFIVRSQKYGGSSTKFSFLTTFGNDGDSLVKRDGNDLVVSPPPLPSKLPPYLTYVICHELAHSFGLSDEYAGLYTERCGLTQIDKVHVSNLGLNVQFRSDLIDDNNELVGAKIKWNWPRIRLAGILKKSPEGFFEEYTITLGHAQLREWNENGFIPYSGREAKSDVYLIKHPFTNPLRRAGHLSCEPLCFKIIEAFPEEDKLKVKLKEGQQFIPEDYPAGSMLFAYTLDTTGNKLNLVADVIVKHITGGGPLNAPSKKPKRDCQEAYDADADTFLNSLYNATNLPPSLDNTDRQKPSLAKKIVGLYEGGIGFACGIYHPAATCIMNSGTFQEIKKTSFCPVCRYILVDLLDPTKHAEIDKEYQTDYPE